MIPASQEAEVEEEGWGWEPVVELLPNMYEALDSIASVEESVFRVLLCACIHLSKSLVADKIEKQIE